jgi:hypothetical protein
MHHADKGYARQLKAGAILEPINKEQPAHPGLAHYIIHTYDFEPLTSSRSPSAGSPRRINTPSSPRLLRTRSTCPRTSTRYWVDGRIPSGRIKMQSSARPGFASWIPSAARTSDKASPKSY